MPLPTIADLMTLGMLILLQAVLGFDNLLYISLESKHAPEKSQRMVRQWGIGIAVVLRIVLLFFVLGAVHYFEKPLFAMSEDGPIGGVLSGEVTLHSLIVLLGGIFILYTALKEIMHMLALHDVAHDVEKKSSSTASVIFTIVAMNLVFSFDSILSAMALTEVFWIMATAIVISGALMIWLADGVSEFLKKNRMYEVLGLFILFVVGVMLISEGGELAELHLFGHPIEAMSKVTFYFVIAILVLVDVVQGRYQKKLMAEQAHEVEAVG